MSEKISCSETKPLSGVWKIKELLKGVEVEWKPLGSVAKVGTGRSNRQDEEENGEYPFYVRSKNILKSNSYQFDETAIVIPGEGGIGDIFHYVEGKYALHQRAYRIHVNDIRLDTKFLYYYMSNSFKQYILSKSVGATSISIRKPMLEKFDIPIPPLQVQSEIVQNLDNFTELTAELTARKKQYSYYRDKLFAFENTQIEFKPLGDISLNISSGGTPKTDIPEYWENGTIPWMSSGEVNLETIYKTEKYITEIGLKKSSAKFVPKNSIVIALAGQGKTRGKVARTRIDLTTNQSLGTITFDIAQINPEFVFHYLKTQYENLRQISSGSGTRGGLNLKMISNYKVPIPYPNDKDKSLQEQQRIVDILDKFDTFTNSISEGLPKEIKLREQQYEYYRDLLLTFSKDKEIK